MQRVPDAIRTRAITEVGSLIRTRLAISVPLAVVAVGAVAILQNRAGFFVAAMAGGVCGAYGVAAFRAIRARQTLHTDPGLAVTYEGWCRAPDGCNFACFRAVDPTDEPFAVVRLPIVREMSKGSGWLFQGRGAAAALVSADGELLGTGRIIDDGLARWNRRAEPTPKNVMNPPKWTPPGG